MPEGALSSFLFQDFPQLQPLHRQAWPVQSRAKCLLFCCALPGSLLKALLAFFPLMPECLILTVAEAVTADKKTMGPRITVHTASVFTASFPVPLTRKEEEKMEDRLLHSCVFILTCFISKRGRQSLQSRHQSAPFNTPFHNNVVLTHEDWQRKGWLLLLV